LPVYINKTPATSRGFFDASRDLAEVARMFKETRGPLVAIATGLPSNVGVLDLDGPDGLAWLAAHRERLPAKHPAVDGCIVATPSPVAMRTCSPVSPGLARRTARHDL